MKQKPIKSQTTQILYQPPKPEDFVYKADYSKLKPKNILKWIETKFPKFSSGILVFTFVVLLTACSYATLVAAADEQIYLAEKYSQLNKGQQP